MFGPDHFGRLLWSTYDNLRRHGQRDRKGVIQEVKEGGGERKARAIVGYTRFGEPVLSPWMSSEENRSGDHRSEDVLKKGQNVSLSGWDLGQATMTPSAEAKHAPRPSHAKLNADTESFGKKMRVAHSFPDSSSGGGGASGGGSAPQGKLGATGGGSSDGHTHEVWVSDQEEKLDEWQQQSGTFGSLGGGAGGAGGAGSSSTSSAGGGQSKQKEKPKVRFAIHEKGDGTGKHSFAAHAGNNDDQDAHVQISEEGSQLLNMKEGFWVDKQGQPYTTKPPKIKACSIKLDKYKSSQSGGGQ